MNSCTSCALLRATSEPAPGGFIVYKFMLLHGIFLFTKKAQLFGFLPLLFSKLKKKSHSI
jgi:hypothetical protein